MKWISVTTLSCFVMSVFISSFICGPPLLNDSFYNKQFYINFLIVSYSLFWIIILWRSSDILAVHISVYDLIIVALLIIYLLFFLIQKSSPLVRYEPFFYAFLFFILKLKLNKISPSETKILVTLFVTLVPIVILFHISLIVIQMCDWPSWLKQLSLYGSTFGNPDMVGSYLATLMPFCLIQKRSFKILGYLSFFAAFVILIVLQARTSLLAILVAGIFWLIMNKQIKLVMGIIILFITIISIIILVLWHPESVFGRLFIWYVSLRMIALKPMGWGLLAFEKDYPLVQASILSENRAVTNFFSPEVVHSSFNEFLNIGVSFGIVSLLLVIVLFYLLIINLIRTKDQLLYPILIFLIVSLFYFPLRISPLILLLVVFGAYLSSKSNVGFRIRFSRKTSHLFLSCMLAISLILTSVSIITHDQYRKWCYSYSLLKKETEISEAEMNFKSLYNKMRTDGRFLITYSNLLYELGNYAEALRILEEAENYFCDISLELKLAKLYEFQGSHLQAMGKYDLAISLAPNRIFATYEKIMFMTRTGDLETAYSMSKELLNRPLSEKTNADTYIIRYKLMRLVREFEREHN